MPHLLPRPLPFRSFHFSFIQLLLGSSAAYLSHLATVHTPAYLSHLATVHTPAYLSHLATVHTPAYLSHMARSLIHI